MSRILVTGAGGYIGSLLVGQLLQAEHKVTAYDRYFFGQGPLAAYAKHPNLSILRKDIRDIEPDDLAGHGAVCDLAALSNDPCGDLDPALTESINIGGRLKVAATAKQAGVGQYVYASSCSVYGHGESDELTETSPTRPLTTYARSMLRGEEGVLALNGPDFTTTILRNATVFGLSPRMRFDLAVNIMTLHAVQRGRVNVMGGGNQWRPLVHVSDVCASMLAVLDAPKEKVSGAVFNIGLRNIRILNLAYIVRETLPFPVEIEVVPDDADKRDYNVSFQGIFDRIGFKARVDIADGVKEVYGALKSGSLQPSPKTQTVQWYKTIVEAQRLINEITLNGRLL